MDWAKALEEDLSWREAELASLKLLAAGEREGTTKCVSLFRALWALLYAHYEGFCKFVWDLFLEEIERQRFSRDMLDEKVMLFSLQKELSLIRTMDDNGLFSYLKNINFSNMPAIFPNRLEAESNLWPNLLISNCEKVGISCEEARGRKEHLKSLVARRNDIAHGKRMIIKNLKEYQPFEDTVFAVMTEVAVSVVDILEKKTYLKRI